MIKRDGQNVKSKFVLPLAIILSLMMFNGKLGFMSAGNVQGACRFQVPGIRLLEGGGENEAGYG